MGFSTLGAQLAKERIISVCGKDYEITGDFMTIIIAENLLFGEPETLSPRVVQRLRKRHENKVDSLMARREALNLSETNLKDSLRLLRHQLSIAEQQAAELSREFATVELKTTSYLYQLAYYFYGKGQLAEALEVLSDEALAGIELKQAQKYLLKANALKLTGDLAGSSQLLKTAFERYPCFGSALAYGRLQLETGVEGYGILPLQMAVELAGSPGERSTGYAALAAAYLAADEEARARLMAGKVLSLNENAGLNQTGEINAARSILRAPVLTPLQKAERYLAAKDFGRFDGIMEKEKVKDYDQPFSDDGYQLKLLYLERLRKDDPAAARKEEKLLKKYLRGHRH